MKRWAVVAMVALTLGVGCSGGGSDGFHAVGKSADLPSTVGGSGSSARTESNPYAGMTPARELLAREMQNTTIEPAPDELSKVEDYLITMMGACSDVDSAEQALRITIDLKERANRITSKYVGYVDAARALATAATPAQPESLSCHQLADGIINVLPGLGR